MDAKTLSDLLSEDVVKVKEERLCSLWAGYGSIVALKLTYRQSTRSPQSIILKKISPPRDSGEAHERKIKSYIVEASFYKYFCCKFSEQGIAVPHTFEAVDDPSGNSSLLLSDLRIDYPINGNGMLDWNKTFAAVDWLARFHAFHWGLPERPSASYDKLWAEGCYWRLDTRRSEYEEIPASWERIKRCAQVVANLLKNGTHKEKSIHQTLIHGDFKSANLQFCEKPITSNPLNSVSCTPRDSTCVCCFECAALDFQYVGVGYGARDVVKLIVSSVDMNTTSSSFRSGGSDGRESQHNKAVEIELRVLDVYYDLLFKYVNEFNSKGQLGSVSSANLSYTREELQRHYELSLIDYVRFMVGWGMWGNTQYASMRCLEILDVIDSGATLTVEEYEEKFMNRYVTS